MTVTLTARGAAMLPLDEILAGDCIEVMNALPEARDRKSVV